MKPVKAPTMHGGLVVLDPDHSYKDYITKVRKERRKEASIKKIQKKLNLKK